MFRNSLCRTLAGVALSLIATGVANAALYLAPNGQGVYDSDQNITWLQNANLNATNSFGVAGTNYPINWSTAESWIGAMNNANYLGVNDWRLPITIQPDPTCDEIDLQGQSAGFNCTASEMGHLSNVDGIRNNSPSPFSNIGVAYYWSSTLYAPGPNDGAWAFIFGSGIQSGGPLRLELNVWPVAPGNPFNAVPIPAGAWLFTSALGLLGLRRKRRTVKNRDASRNPENARHTAVIAVVAAGLLGTTAAANATLYSAGFGIAVYDSTQDITWLANANLAAIDTFGVSGISSTGTMDWPTAQSWISAMNAAYGGAGYLGVNNWRLPNTIQPDPTCDNQHIDRGIPVSEGRECTGSEMGHLYNVDGVTTSSPGLLTNLQPANYWSGMLYAPSLTNGPPFGAWFFDFRTTNRLQSVTEVSGGPPAQLNVEAVAPGNPFNAVPIAPAYFLFPSALAALGWVRRKEG